MAKLNRAFNADDVAHDSYELLADGWYTAQIENSEIKQTRAGDGSYISLMFKILIGKNTGRTVYTMFNIDNPSAKTVEIAERNLAQLCDAIGVRRLEDTQELHGKPLQIKIATREAADGYDAQNEIKGYKKMDGEPQQSRQPSPQSQQAPWAR